MAFLKKRNPQMNPRYANITIDYMRNGEELGLRWDYAFFQMIVETASLKYTGDVRPQQNNFAGLGATGNGVRGESFPSVAKGVRAHLQHVLMYSGAKVINPVAERTRKVQEWQVLTKWQKSIKRPITFKDLTSKWSPGDRGYPRDIAKIGDIFFSEFCNGPDPQPELVAAARGGKAAPTQQANLQAAPSSQPATEPQANKPETKKVAEKVAEKPAAAPPAPSKKVPEKSQQTKQPSSSATQAAAKQPEKQPEKKKSAQAANVKVLNPTKAPETKSTEKKTEKPIKTADAGASAAAAGAATAQPPAKKKASNCRVWTASYGGSKAIIIKAQKSGVTNYTVLDVNKGKEKREAAAYIAAYAKGGTTIGQFNSPSAALDKAFQLCPEE